MNKKAILAVKLLILVLAVSMSVQVHAYDDENVHPAINEKAGRKSKINDYIKTKLGYAEGIEKQIRGKEVWWWLREGGKVEDSFPRPLLHFHDPLKHWDSAGLWGVNSSSILWAQRGDNEASWQKARGHYYQALTTGSETEYATTFKTLGQLMHLVADLAVPAHVRNDPHPFQEKYEAWTKDKAGQDPNSLTYTGSAVGQSIFNFAVTTPGAPAPITALWDLEEPGAAITPGSVVGLAEYTNANFFSEDTVYDYASPNNIIGSPEVIAAEDNKPDTLIYIYGQPSNSAPIKMGAISFINLDAFKKGKKVPLTMDDNVNQDYASLLVPAAVGYSTALLDYFFRGDIDLRLDPSTGGYSLVNNSAEDMTGLFELWYDGTNGTRQMVPLVNTKMPANGQTPIVGFTAPADHASPPNYTLVFNKGNMGQENGAVVGRKVSLISKECLLIIMSTSFIDTSVIPKEETPDIAIMWDMETNSYAHIIDTNDTAISFPIPYQELMARTKNLNDYQQADSEKLLSIGTYTGDKIPDCPLTYQNNEQSGQDGLCNEWRKNSLTGSGNCATTSPFSGGHNTISITESGNGNTYTLRDSEDPPTYCSPWRYITTSSDLTNEKTISINSAGENTVDVSSHGASLLYFAGASLYPNSHQIFILNNTSGAENKLLNSTLAINETKTTHLDSAYEHDNGGYGCGLDWISEVYHENINSTIYNDFFEWVFNLSANSSVDVKHNNYTSWDDGLCGDYRHWSPQPEMLSETITLTALSDDVNGVGIQSVADNPNQFQIGIINSSIREINITSMKSNDTMGTSATYGPIHNFTKTYYSRWPSDTNNTGTLARNRNPWSLPLNNSLAAAVEEMRGYFALNYGNDPAQLRPKYFEGLKFDGFNTPLTIAKQNIWMRNFDVQYLATP